ncbi:hypothetical protein COO60DRAFT_1570281 [Scenedesmus sp. NREL 46B-D3]|nr:hypothetical protein COO60DRAFT_1570281 [Scenedesmus sp. NREL 46B-D3]
MAAVAAKTAAAAAAGLAQHPRALARVAVLLLCCCLACAAALQAEPDRCWVCWVAARLLCMLGCQARPGYSRSALTPLDILKRKNRRLLWHQSSCQTPMKSSSCADEPVP